MERQRIKGTDQEYCGIRGNWAGTTGNVCELAGIPGIQANWARVTGNERDLTRK
jgi:hypothetical protein